MQRQFRLLVYSTIAMLIIDSACWLLDGTTFPHARAINVAVETLYYLLNILIPFLWAVYVELAQSKEPKIAYRRLRMLAVPILLLTLLIIANLWTHTVFVIDENNVYHRNPGFLTFAAGAYGYLVYAAVRALQAARRASWSEDKRRYYPMAIVMALPAIGGIIQTFFYGMTLIWVFVAVSILMLYIDDLNRQISADPLTGINNRRELEKYLLRETREPVYDGILALIMMDVDGFKQVNDQHGHYYGDGILVTVSDILKQSCKNTRAFLARYGGDEFCIVYPAGSTREVEDIILKIKAGVARWNEESSEPARIGLSIGYSVWYPEADEDVCDLYKRADRQMYLAKNMKKNAEAGA